MTVTASGVFSALRTRADRVLMNTYARQPLTLVRGHGVWVEDSDGRELLDLVAGIAVNVLGHAHPALLNALHDQAERMIHTSNLYYTEPQVELGEMLVASAFPSRVFFCNSGAEANEGAIKLARKWGAMHKDGASQIVCAEGAFHGRTLGALTATATKRYQEPFKPLAAGFSRVPFNDLAALEQAIDDATCAVMLEPIQGESGIHALDTGFLRRLRRLCDERNVLLILDEVQSGMGRTGAWWAHQHDGVAPDVMTVAKGLGGGVPIGAILSAPRADIFEPGDHGATFGGNPLACAAGIAVIDTVNEHRLLDHVVTVGDYFIESLKTLAAEGFPVAGLRGRGLMLGLALSQDIAPQVSAAALQCGLIVNAIGARTLRIVPPLIITREEIDEAMLRLRSALGKAVSAAN
jgi:predicted acetylornithine/succinylornithine family transaminase